VTTIPQQSAHRAAYATPGDIAAGQVTGIGYAIDVESGKPIAVYMNDTPPPPPPAAHQPAPVPQPVIVQQAPRDPWTGRIAASGGAIAGVAATVGHYASELGQAAHAAEGIGIAVGVAALGISLLKGSSAKVTVNITNSNTGSTSHATSNANAASTSASGWKNRLQ
jgi:hypothetical protein